MSTSADLLTDALSLSQLSARAAASAATIPLDASFANGHGDVLGSPAVASALTEAGTQQRARAAAVAEAVSAAARHPLTALNELDTADGALAGTLR